MPKPKRKRTATDKKKRETVEMELKVVGRIARFTAEIHAKWPHARLTNWRAVAPLQAMLEEMLVETAAMGRASVEALEAVRTVLLSIDFELFSFTNFEDVRRREQSENVRAKLATYDAKLDELVRGIRSMEGGSGDAGAGSSDELEGRAGPSRYDFTSFDAQDWVKALKTAIKNKKKRRMIEEASNIMDALAQGAEGALLFVAAGGVPVLLKMARKNDLECVLPAVGALALMAEASSLCCQQIGDNHGVEVMEQVCKMGDPIADMDAAIITLNVMARDEDMIPEVVKAGMIRHFVRIVETKQDPSGVTYGIQNLYLVAEAEGAVEQIAECGGIDTLAQVLSDAPDDDTRFRIAFLFERLAEHSEERCDQIFGSGAIDTLIEMTRTKNDEIVGIALSALGSYGFKREVYDAIIAKDGINHLINIVNQGSDDLKDVASRVMLCMAEHADMSEQLVKSGAVASLRNLLQARRKSITDGQMDRCVLNVLEIFATIMQKLERYDFMNVNDDFDVLVDVLKKGDKLLKDPAQAIVCGLSEREDIQHKIIDTGVIKVLLDWAVEDNYAEVLENLVTIADRTKMANQIVHDDGINLCVSVLKNGVDEMKDFAVQLIEKLATNEEWLDLIGRAGSIVGLLEHARTEAQAEAEAGQNDEAHAVKALISLAALEENKRRIVHAGGKQILREMLARAHQDAATGSIQGLLILLEVENADANDEE